MQWRVTNALPGAEVYFLLSVDGPGAGPCAPDAPVCLDILSPKLAGSRTVNAFGGASITALVPEGKTGKEIYFQSAWFLDGQGDKTEVDVATVE